MKKLLLATALLATSITTAQSATFWTPQVIKASLLSGDEKLISATAGYISGLNQTFKALQHYNLLDKYLCVPDSVTTTEMAVLVFYQSTDGFAKTSDGGAHFVFTALYNKYPCKLK